MAYSTYGQLCMYVCVSGGKWKELLEWNEWAECAEVRYFLRNNWNIYWTVKCEIESGIHSFWNKELEASIDTHQWQVGAYCYLYSFNKRNNTPCCLKFPDSLSGEEAGGKNGS